MKFLDKICTVFVGPSNNLTSAIEDAVTARLPDSSYTMCLIVERECPRGTKIRINAQEDGTTAVQLSYGIVPYYSRTFS